MIDLHNVGFAYEDQAKIIQQVDLEVKAGEFIVLCGKSGCGKSTLLRILNGLIPELYAGDLTGTGTVLEQDLLTKEFNAYVREIGVVFQNPKTQFFTSDVYSELAFAMENYGVPQNEMIARIKEITRLFSLEEFLERSMFHLSGGEKQLIAFASASMLKHRLFLLDEPSSNLDEATIDRLKTYLQVLKEQGMTIIVSEHRLYYLTELADRYLVMDKGEIIKSYSRQEMDRKSPADIRAMGLRSLEQTYFTKCRVETKEIGEVVLTCEGLDFHYRKQASVLNIPSLRLTSGSITGIIGHNGAGKSTFSKILSGLVKVKQGMIQLNGSVMSAKELIKESFVVMQDVNLQLFFETVEKEIRLNAKNIHDVDKVVKMLNLESLLTRHPQTLSGGEKQRVAIASAVLSGKKLLIFDEPTSGLDLLHMEEVSNTIRWLLQANILVLVITHDKEFLNQTCQRVLHFDQGQIIEDYFIETH
ncbi:cobalt ABC transporter [Enterococcus ureilyticus]|uniref:Cobalt ABC transporter n=1 Tax=Enterococcus ureilyticus TaxID=1131292 RepID=A0A1E5HD80_9ENTE|nr:ABC transporter ATP-binding protein [Enterococcus ureilyticus]MBM7687688.1 energy-coupling factor transport system ATP-binding protein [Enterococcus ureilyticus]OEG22796.1 cobalt ABC transporter [Enterococcus ureilyticus]